MEKSVFDVARIASVCIRISFLYENNRENKTTCDNLYAQFAPRNSEIKDRPFTIADFRLAKQPRERIYFSRALRIDFPFHF